MKNRLIVTTALIVLTISTSTNAQQQSSNEYVQNINEGNRQEHRERFEARKNELIRNLQNRLSCVEKSRNPEQLRSCFPKRGA